MILGLLKVLFALYWGWVTVDFAVYAMRNEFSFNLAHVLGVLVVVGGWAAVLS